MIHYFWTGHFDEEGGHVRFTHSNDGDSTPRPVVRRPLDAAAVAAALRRTVGGGPGAPAPPRHWGVTLTDDGVIMSDQHTKFSDAVEFVASVAEATGAQIWADNGLRRLTPEAMRREWADRSSRLARARRRERGNSSN